MLFNGKSDRRMIGILVSPKRHAYLSLFTLAKGLTKAKLYRDIMEAWIDDQAERETEVELIKQLLHRVQTQYNIMNARRPSYTLESYKIEVEADLLKKGIREDYVAIIIRELK